ncbi:MAG: ATP-binding protein [Steroidobacteraceae bacterium]
MNRLSVRIFLAFFGAMLAIVAGAILITWWILVDRQEESGAALRELTRGAAVALASGGREGLERWLASDAARLRGRPLLVLDEDGHELLDRPVPVRHALGRHIDPERHFAEAPGIVLRPAQRLPLLVGPDGTSYRLLPPPRGMPGLGPFGLPDTRGPLLALALAVTALVSLALARSITRPVRDLQRATAALAAGHLDARVAPATAGRSDELGRLGSAFDGMAGRLAVLIAAREQLLRDVSHELRSPLARMRLAIGLARQPGSDAQRQLERVELEIGRLDALVGSILDVSRLEAGAGALAPEPLDLVALVDRIAADARFEAQSLGKRLEWQPPEAALPVQADPGWLSAAIENVVRNALRHTADGSAVQITVAAQPGAAQAESGPRGVAVVTVRDAGPGLPESDLERVFEPFYRVERDRAGGSGGTGLGLAIAARVLRAHGGTIEARNLPAAGGSARPAGLEVRLRWPRQAAPARVAPPA